MTLLVCALSESGFQGVSGLVLDFNPEMLNRSE